MKRLAILIACAFAGVVGLACTVVVLSIVADVVGPRRQPRDTVQGMVVDRDSGAPLSGVSLVCISGYPLSFYEHRDEVKTDAQGRFTLPILHKDFHIEVRKKGYASRKISWMPRENLHSQMRVIGLARNDG